MQHWEISCPPSAHPWQVRPRPQGPRGDLSPSDLAVLTGDARTAGQRHFEEVFKDVTVFQRDEGTFQKNTEFSLPGMWGMSGNIIKQDAKAGLKRYQRLLCWPDSQDAESQ